MGNQLIDESLSLYNYLRTHVSKVITSSYDRMRLNNLIIRAFYRFERRKLMESRPKFNPSRTPPTRETDLENETPMGK
jgi:hypothetical protein